MRFRNEYQTLPMAIAVVTALVVAAHAMIAGLSDALRWVTWANTALAASTVLYLVYLWFRSEPTGVAASALAAGGAAGLVLTLALQSRGASSSGLGLFEGTALLSAGAVLAYLAMEGAYRNRSAGIVVMPAVMAAVACEIWLIDNGLASAGYPPGGLAAYWEASHRFAFCLGYCPLALAAGLALAASLGRPLPDPAARGAMATALGVGAPLIALGAGMGTVRALVVPEAPAGIAAELVLTWLAAALALGVWTRAQYRADPQLTRHAFIVFALATAGLALSLTGPAHAG